MTTPRKASTTARKPATPAGKASRPAAAPTPTPPAQTKAPAAEKPGKALKAGAKGKTVKPAKPEKIKKPKLVRDSFTIPKDEYAVIDELKIRAAKAGTPTKKSELLRAGIKALAAMGDAHFKAALKAVPVIKTGRPAKD